MIAQLAQKIYTIVQYLEIEDKSEIRHKYIEGEITPMTGGTTNHNLVAGNIYLALRIALKGTNNIVYRVLSLE